MSGREQAKWGGTDHPERDWIVLDLEWNSPAMGEPPRLYRGVKLPGEIVEIGAVRLSKDHPLPLRSTDLSAFERFSIRVRPQFYQKLNPYTAKVTGLTQAALNQGVLFSQAWRCFLQWAGPQVRLAAWSQSDAEQLQIQLRGMEGQGFQALPPDWIDVQALYSCVLEGCFKQRSVATALQTLEIDCQEPLHQAVIDAFYTARILETLQSRLGAQAESMLEDFIYHPAEPMRDKKDFTAETEAAFKAQINQATFCCPTCQAQLPLPLSWRKASGQNRLQAEAVCPQGHAIELQAKWRVFKGGDLVRGAVRLKRMSPARKWMDPIHRAQNGWPLLDQKQDEPQGEVPGIKPC